MSKKTGGPAFPNWYVKPDTGEMVWFDSGMTLRDYFMAHLNDECDTEDWGDFVKQEIVGRPRPNSGDGAWLSVLEWEAEFRAKWRAIRADAMIKAREQ